MWVIKRAIPWADSLAAPFAAKSNERIIKTRERGGHAYAATESRHPSLARPYVLHVT
jgi:hypothetical protein